MRLLSQMMHLRCPSVEIEIFNSMGARAVFALQSTVLVMVQLQTLHLNE
jgi:hypothetical protein